MTSASKGYQKEKREQGIKNLFEEIMTKNFPNLVKENDTSPESTESQTKQTQKGPHQDAS